MTTRDMIRAHEGCKLQMYMCPSGANTIGYGHNLDAKPIRQEVAELILDHDIEDAMQDAIALSGDLWWRLSDVRRSVLVNMALNLGRGGLSGFINMFGAMRRGNYYIASQEMLDSRWATQVGHRSAELAHMMHSGEWTKIE